MEENKQIEESTSLLDILKLLLSKIKILILVLIIGAIVGGGAAVISTININYWGTTVEFYVNPEKKSSSESTASGSIAAAGSQYGVYGAYGRHVMDNIVKLLNSDIFAEQLILDGETLPKKDVWVDPESQTEVALKLNDKIDAANAANAIANDKQAEADVHHSIVNNLSAEYSQKMAELNLQWSKANLTTQSKVFNESEYLNIQGQYPDLDAAYNTWIATRTTLTAAQKTANEAQTLANQAKTETNALTQIALDAWRETQKYKTMHALYKNSVSYSYLNDEDDFDDANNLARSFIYVKISVLDNKEFATTVLERVKTQVPVYIKANMAIPDGYTGTNCQRITTKDHIDLTNPGYTKNEAIKYAVLVALAATVIACVVIIVVDKSDKRLRDTEAITRLFDVPVLGIVPTIEELTEESNAKKNAANTEVK